MDMYPTVAEVEGDIIECKNAIKHFMAAYNSHYARSMFVRLELAKPLQSRTLPDVLERMWLYEDLQRMGTMMEENLEDAAMVHNYVKEQEALLRALIEEEAENEEGEDGEGEDEEGEDEERGDEEGEEKGGEEEGENEKDGDV